MDAAGSERAAIVATGDGVPASLLFAADHPECVRSLTLFNGFARLAHADDYPAGMPTRMQQQMLDEIHAGWGTPGNYRLVAPSVGDDPDFQQSFSRRLGQSVDRGAAHWLLQASLSTDVRDRLGRISSPTLVLHRADNPFARAAHGRYLADHIPGARYVELDGDDHIWWLGDSAPAPRSRRGVHHRRASGTGQPRERPAVASQVRLGQPHADRVAVVQLMAQGLTNDQIAAHMFISKATVKTHLNHVYAKVGLASAPSSSPRPSDATCERRLSSNEPHDSQRGGWCSVRGGAVHDPHVGLPVGAFVEGAIDVERGQSFGEHVRAVIGEPHPGPRLPVVDAGRDRQ